MTAPQSRRRRQMRRRGSKGPSRCRKCGGRIKWLTLGDARWRFDPNPIDPRTHAGPPAYPVEGQRAWRLGDLIEELMGRREVTEAQARDKAFDMPWHRLHTCRSDAPDEPTEETS